MQLNIFCKIVSNSTFIPGRDFAIKEELYIRSYLEAFPLVFSVMEKDATT